MAVLNLKISQDKCPPETQDQDKAEFKVGRRYGIYKESCSS